MALTDLQRTICRLIAENRIASGESYVAGGVALAELTGASRISRDIDLFHDTDEALESSWRADRQLLAGHGFSITVLRERPSFVEAEVGRQGDSVRMEWARDSSFRFFPLVRHPDLGLTLHPVDLATNKVLALQPPWVISPGPPPGKMRDSARGQSWRRRRARAATQPRT